jgi:hypothetical protein
MIAPSSLGYQAPVYAYNYFDRYGAYLRPTDRIKFSVPDNGTYWIVVPVGRSGIGFLGDADKFASNGTQRIARADDNGEFSARVMLAERESRVRLHGFSATAPEVRASEGAIENLAYDAETRRFQFDLSGAGPATDVLIHAGANRQEQ